MKVISLLTATLMILTLALGIPVPASAAESGQVISLSSQENPEGFTHSATLGGVEVPEYDYTWHIDPAKPEPYYTGTAPADSDGVYIAHDIYYYPLLDQEKFQKVSYDGENEWVYFYEAEGLESYIFSTLPVLKTGFPTRMMHTPEEAYENAVLHINKAGVYTLKGDWHGQIRIDLGEDSFDDPEQKVTLILDGVNITCTVASGIVFAEVYECDNGWEDAQSHSHIVDTTDAGAILRIADGSENSVSGTNIFRLLKPKYKEDDATETYPAQKKLLKVDGALYSYRSMNIEGDSGILNITSGFEGMNSELHLTVNGGNVRINSQDDGINVNEDGVSVLTVNGGNLHICAGLGAEGDGIDSNGYLVINGGTVISAANPGADSGMDSDKGSYVNGGTVISLGSTMDWAKADGATANQAILNMRFSGSQSADEAIIITDTDDKVLFAYDPDKDEAMGSNGRTYSGAVLSAPNLKVGETVRIYIGGNVTGKENSGVYDITTVEGFEGAALQCYSGNTLGGFGGGRQERPDGNQFGGEKPEGMQFGGEKPGDMPEDGQRPEMPEGMQPNFPNGFGGGTGATCAGETDFVLSEIVNAFSGVSDLQHTPEKQGDIYVCQACGSRFADEACTQSLGAAPNFQWLIYIGVFLAGAACASAVFTVVLLIRKKKA